MPVSHEWISLKKLTRIHLPFLPRGLYAPRISGKPFPTRFSSVRYGWSAGLDAICYARQYSSCMCSV